MKPTPQVTPTLVIEQIGPLVDEPGQTALIALAGPQMGTVFLIDNDGATIGRGDECDVMIVDDGVSREHCRLELTDEGARLVDLGSTNGTWTSHGRIDNIDIMPGDRFRVGEATVLRFCVRDADEANFHRDLYQAAVTDGLTGAYNRRYFNERMHAELAFASRHGTRLSLVLFDIDHFKAVNDTCGHAFGDSVLTELSERIRGQIRSEDVFARFGGDEFGLIARGLGASQGATMAERLRAIIDSQPFGSHSDAIRVTISVGVATLEPGDTAMSLFDRADKALYQAKAEGRNSAVSAASRLRAV